MRHTSVFTNFLAISALDSVYQSLSRHSRGNSYLRRSAGSVLSRTVSGTCRSEEKREVLLARGFQAHLFNPDDDEGLGCLPQGLNASELVTVVRVYT